MTFALKKSTQFYIHELVLVTKGGNIDITKIYEEINIFDSLLTTVMTGNILIKDANGSGSSGFMQNVLTAEMLAIIASLSAALPLAVAGGAKRKISKRRRHKGRKSTKKSK